MHIFLVKCTYLYFIFQKGLAVTSNEGDKQELKQYQQRIYNICVHSTYHNNYLYIFYMNVSRIYLE